MRLLLLFLSRFFPAFTVCSHSHKKKQHLLLSFPNIILGDVAAAWLLSTLFSGPSSAFWVQATWALSAKNAFFIYFLFNFFVILMHMPKIFEYPNAHSVHQKSCRTVGRDQTAMISFNPKDCVFIKPKKHVSVTWLGSKQIECSKLFGSHLKCR